MPELRKDPIQALVNIQRPRKAAVDFSAAKAFSRARHETARSVRQ